METFICRADDFGLSKAYDLGLLDSLASSIVKNVSLLVNMPQLKKDVHQLLAYPIDLGLHFNLCLGKATSPNPSTLTDPSGNFFSSSYYRDRMQKESDPFREEDVDQEARAQMEAFIQLVGKKPDYIDYHVFLTPSIEKALQKVAQEYDVVCKLHFKKEKATSDRAPFYERKEPFSSWLEQGQWPKEETTLLIFHPGFLDQDVLRLSSLTKLRCTDHAFLLDQEVQTYFRKQGKSIRYSEL